MLVECDAAALPFMGSVGMFAVISILVRPGVGVGLKLRSTYTSSSLNFRTRFISQYHDISRNKQLLDKRLGFRADRYPQM